MPRETELFLVITLCMVTRRLRRAGVQLSTFNNNSPSVRLKAGRKQSTKAMREIASASGLAMTAKKDHPNFSIRPSIDSRVSTGTEVTERSVFFRSPVRTLPGPTSMKVSIPCEII